MAKIVKIKKVFILITFFRSKDVNTEIHKDAECGLNTNSVLSNIQGKAHGEDKAQGHTRIKRQITLHKHI